jgi:hypothetical protein
MIIFRDAACFQLPRSTKTDFNAKSKLLSRFNLIWGVQMERKKYSTSNRFRLVAISVSFLPARGAYRDRHGRWVGMQWMLSAPLTNGVKADGKVVWS